MICLTFDTDWMRDRDLERFLAEFPIPGRATFFLHDRLPSLFATGHELCPHPFIENLGNWQEPLESLARDLPRPCKGVRPHSCVFSHMIGVGLHKLGYRYVSQATSLYLPGIAPARHPWGIWEMPIYYMDNMDFCTPKNWPGIGHEVFDPRVIRTALEREGLYVFDFHPLHIALNTGSHAHYEAVKDRIVSGGSSPFDLARAGRGTREFFLELCSAMRNSGRHSYSCWDALQQLGSALV
jgi:hypothetical protein